MLQRCADLAHRALGEGDRLRRKAARHAAAGVVLRGVARRADLVAPYEGYLALELTPVDASTTRAVYGGDLRMRGMLRLLEPLMAGEAQQGVAKELKRLKELVESGRG